MNLPWITGHRKSLVGIDISSASVKLVQLEVSGDAYQLTHFARVPLKEGAMVEGEIYDMIAVSEAVEAARLEAKSTIPNAATAVFGSSVMIKQVTMNAGLCESDMESQTWVEANKHFPELINDIKLDFQILGINEKDASLIDVLLVASRSDKVEQRVEVLSSAGMKPKVIDVDYYANYRATQLLSDQVIDGGDNKSVAYIHLGIYNASLLVIDNHNLVYTRSQTFNGSSIVDLAKQQIGVKDWVHGYMYKACELTADDRQALVNVIAPGLVPNIRQFLQFFYSASSHDVVDQVVLSGECTLVPELGREIGEQLMIPTVIANPMQNIEIDSHLNEEVIRALGPAMMLCTGLAMREVPV